MLHPVTWEPGSFDGAVRGAKEGCCHTLPSVGLKSCFVYCKLMEKRSCLEAGCPKQVTAKGNLGGGKSKKTVEGGRGKGPSLGDQ